MGDLTSLGRSRERKISPTTRRFLSGAYLNPPCPKLEVRLALAGPLGCGKSALAVRYMTKRYIGDYDPKLEDTYQRVDRVDGNDVKVRIMDTSDYEVMTENVVVCPSDLCADRYLGWADCVILVFSVVSAKSFIDLDVYLQAWSTYSDRARKTSLPGGLRSRRASHHGANYLDNLKKTNSDSTDNLVGVGNSSGNRFLKATTDMPTRAMTPTATSTSSSTVPSPALILVAAKSDLETSREVSRSEAERLAVAYDATLVEVSAAEDPDSVDRMFAQAAREGMLTQEKHRQQLSRDEKERTFSFLHAFSGGSVGGGGVGGTESRPRSPAPIAFFTSNSNTSNNNVPEVTVGSAPSVPGRNRVSIFKGRSFKGIFQ